MAVICLRALLLQRVQLQFLLLSSIVALCPLQLSGFRVAASVCPRDLHRRSRGIFLTSVDSHAQGRQLCLGVCSPSASMHSVFVLLMLVLWGHAAS